MTLEFLDAWLIIDQQLYRMSFLLCGKRSVAGIEQDQGSHEWEGEPQSL